MRKFKILSGRTMAAALSAAMIFQGTALAGPLDELNEILEKQVEAAGDSLLEQTVGFSDLADLMDEKGLNFQMTAKLLPESLELMDLTGEEFADETVRFGFQLNPELEKWVLTAGFGEESSSILDAALYGSQEQLALALPQFYAGAVALNSGNLKEQIMNSDLAAILGMTPESMAEIPDIEMSFYPYDDGTEGFEDYSERMEEELEESAVVEATEADGVTTYAVTFSRDKLMDVYRYMFEEYMSVFTGAGMVFGTGSDTELTVDEMVDQMVTVMSACILEDLTVNYEVRNNLVEKMYFEMPIDTAKIVEAQDQLSGAQQQIAEEMIESVAVEQLAPAGKASDAVADVDAVPSVEVSGPTVEVENEFKGTVYCDVVYFNPAQPQEGFTVNVEMADDAGTDFISMGMDFATKLDGTMQIGTITLDLEENGENIYSGTVYEERFDAATGDLNAQVLVEAEGTRVELNFDGTFSNIEKGKGFVLTVDELSMVVDGEKLGVSGEISLNADAGDVSAPADSRAILELKQEDLVGLVSEISTNAYIWSMQFTPQTETSESTVAIQ